MKILTAKQMNQVDRLTTDRYGLPSLILMENAGLNLYLALEDYFEDLPIRRIAIFCGKGNNGGDGLVLARQLVQRAIYPDVYLLSRVDDISGDARINLEAYLKSGEIVHTVTSDREWQEVEEGIYDYDIIIDALLGTGMSKPLKGLYAKVVADVNNTGAFVLSVDIPSGMFSDSLKGGVETVLADATVTFTAPKIAHILNQDQEAIGDLRIVPIGTPLDLLEQKDFYLNLMSREQVRSYLLPREVSSHKGDFGHVAVVGGSRGKSGAAILSARGALRAGSGLVTVYTPDVAQSTIASFQPELMTEGLASTSKGAFSKAATAQLLDVLQERDAAGMGPGLTTEKETIEFVNKVVQDSPVPMVLDADALNAFAGRIEKLKNRRRQPLVLTPHPGEFARLLSQPTASILENKVELSRKFAETHGVWLVLKSFRTLVAAPDGEVYVCPLGNPGMASAGMGDVLTGVLTSLLGLYAARGMTELAHVTRATVLGVYLHSLAGDLAAAQTGPEALAAGDVIENLGRAYLDLARAEPA
ncbi:MAG: NAD(P)H-hydrate dehydratase [Acidobacteriota bacterium]